MYCTCESIGGENSFIIWYQIGQEEFCVEDLFLGCYSMSDFFMIRMYVIDS